MTPLGWSIVVAGWVIWVRALLQVKSRPEQAQIVDRRARFGVLLQSTAYWLLFCNAFWQRQADILHIAGTLGFVLVGCLLVHTARRALGRHWRVDAGLNRDHELVQSGPYQLVRHPIYLSMFCMLVATGLIAAPVQMLAGSSVLFVIGTQIRTTVEDNLLAGRFGEEFRTYRSSVSSWIPLRFWSSSGSR